MSTSVGVLAVAANPADVAQRARRAEDAGLDAAWAAELHDRTAMIGAAAMAQATSRVTVGTGIAYAFGRTPMVLAAEAADIDALSNGRFVLGLGTGTIRMQQDWHGLDGAAPAPRLEELVRLLRLLWRANEEPVDHEGRFYRVKLSPTARTGPPVREAVPVYLAGFNRRMIEAAGAVGDGFIGHPVFTPEHVHEVVRPALQAGATRAGRSEPIPTVGYVITVADRDARRARRRAAARIAFYATVRTYAPVFARHGYDDVVVEVRTAWQRGDFAAMAKAVPDEMVDVYAAAGEPDEVRARIEARWAPLYDRLVLAPAGPGDDDFDAVVSAVTR